MPIHSSKTLTTWSVTIKPGETREVRGGVYVTNRGRGICKLVIETAAPVKQST